MKAGLPPGVLNYVPMSRENAPKLVTELIANPLIRHINVSKHVFCFCSDNLIIYSIFKFTGSDTVGRLIASEAGKYLKPCVFELGGKAPAVVSLTLFLEVKHREYSRYRAIGTTRCQH